MDELVRTNKRKLLSAIVVLVALCTLASRLAFPADALAWDNCPKGLVNDPYPGACSRYVDTNSDGVCDLSQSEPVASTTTTTQPKETTTTSLAVTTTTSGEPPTGDCPLGPCTACGACFSLGLPIVSSSNEDDTIAVASVAGVAAVSVTTTTIPPSSGSSDDSGSPVGTTGGTSTQANAVALDEGTSTSPKLFSGYNVSPIAIGFFLVYVVSFALYKTRRIRVTTHRKIWNVLLLGTFLITGIFGLILTIQLDYELPFKVPINLLFWHVEAGIAMTLISLFHVGWHLNYYLNLVRRGRRKARAANRGSGRRDVGTARPGLGRPEPGSVARVDRMPSGAREPRRVAAAGARFPVREAESE